MDNQFSARRGSAVDLSLRFRSRIASGAHRAGLTNVLHGNHRILSEDSLLVLLLHEFIQKTHDPGHGYPRFGSTPWRNTRIAINKVDTTVKI